MRKIYITAVGTVDAHLLEKIRAKLKELYGLETQVVETSGYPLYAFEPKRSQYYSKRILQEMLCKISDAAGKLICLTDADLCTPVLTFVYGEAQLDGGVAIVSLHRLRPEYYHLSKNDDLLFERVMKEVIHELGHCYGLYHCKSQDCVMNLSNNIMLVDRKNADFCDTCRQFFIELIKD